MFAIQIEDGSWEPKPAPKLSRTPGNVTASPRPLVGQHTVDIMTSLGYSSHDIHRLLKQNVIGQQIKGSL